MSARCKTFIWLTAVALCALFLNVTSLSAKERELKKFYSEIDVLPNGSVDVTENITFRFIGGPWQGIYRNIPVEYAGPRGINYTLFLSVKRVTDETGPSL